MRLKQWHLYLVLILVALIGVLLLVQAVPGGQAIVSTALKVWRFLKSAVLGTLVFVVITGGPFLAAMALRWWGIPRLDDLFDYNTDITGWPDFFINLVFSVLFAGLWLVVVPWLAAMPTWVNSMFRSIDPGWNSIYETPPIWWGVWSLATFFGGYYAGKGGHGG